MYNNIFPLSYWNSQNTDERAFDSILASIRDREIFFNYKSIIDLVDVKDKFVVDIGCGVGRVADRMIERGAKSYTGIDFSENMIKRAKEFHTKTNINFMQNEGDNIPLPDNSVDVVNAELIFQHCPKICSQNYMNEVKRVLRKDGVFISQIPRNTVYEGGFSEEEIKNIFSGYEVNYFEDIFKTNSDKFYLNLIIKKI